MRHNMTHALVRYLLLVSTIMLTGRLRPLDALWTSGQQSFLLAHDDTFCPVYAVFIFNRAKRRQRVSSYCACTTRLIQTLELLVHVLQEGKGQALCIFCLLM